jgi:hypothetical protein
MPVPDPARDCPGATLGPMLLDSAQECNNQQLLVIPLTFRSSTWFGPEVTEGSLALAQCCQIPCPHVKEAEPRPMVTGAGRPPHERRCEKRKTNRIIKSVVSTATATEIMMPASAIPSPASPVVRICWRAMTPQMIPAGQKRKAATRATMANVFVFVGVRSNAWAEDRPWAPG